jgi:phosphoglycolate phosphatase
MNDQLVIFDLDGTLFDTPSAIVEAFSAVFFAIEATPKDPEEIRSTVGLPLAKAFGKLLNVAENSAEVSFCVAEYLACFKRLILPKAAHLLYPGVTDGLNVLRSNKILLAVATNKFQSSAEALLEASAIRTCFSEIVGADRVRNPKPHPEAIEWILAQTGADPRKALMIGDTTLDIEMASAAGIRSIGVTYGVHTREQILAARPTHIASTFDEVLARIGEQSREEDPHD